MSNKKIILSILLILAHSLYSNSNLEEKNTTLEVFTSIVPQKFFVERIGGNRINCSVLVGPGKSPATYQPTPKQIVSLSSADILFTTGVPFEEAYLNKVIDTLENLIVIDCSEGITKRTIDSHEHHDDGDEHHDDGDEHHDDGDEHHDDGDEHHDDGDEHHDDGDEHHDDGDEHHAEGQLDPHVWLSPTLVKIQAKNILDALIKLDPEGQQYYTNRFNQFLDELDNVIKEIHIILDPYKDNKMLVYHPSFGYFTDEFGLEQIAIETGGKEPTPRVIEKIINEAIEEQIKILVVQPEFSEKSAKIIADAINGTVTQLNPLEIDYIKNIKHIAQVLSKAYSN